MPPEIRSAINALPPGDERPRILIVDDSAVARAVIERAVEASGRFYVSGACANAKAALYFLEAERVDGIILDIEMPGIDGLSALPDLISASGGAKVLIVSSIARDGAAATIEALALGAADTLFKPDAGGFAGRFSQAVSEKLDRLFEADPAPYAVSLHDRKPNGGFDIVAIGASTGGIHALGLLLREIPQTVTAPILITQHLPASFMPFFAAQLAVLAARPCDVASDCLRIRPGRIVIAPGDAHLRVVGTGDGAAIRLSAAPAPSGCLPSVDPMFESLAEVYGERVLAIVLSGMGRDGSIGARRVMERGGCVIAQDRESSVVWGMPGAVANAGLASAIMAPAAIGKLVAARRRPTA
ncbi:MAG: response regulator [Pseudomonadota bacterium]|nr:response regulator [Pseudomonadota bacterium]